VPGLEAVKLGLRYNDLTYKDVTTLAVQRPPPHNIEEEAEEDRADWIGRNVRLYVNKDYKSVEYLQGLLNEASDDFGPFEEAPSAFDQLLQYVDKLSYVAEIVEQCNYTVGDKRDVLKDLQLRMWKVIPARRRVEDSITYVEIYGRPAGNAVKQFTGADKKTLRKTFDLEQTRAVLAELKQLCQNNMNLRGCPSVSQSRRSRSGRGGSGLPQATQRVSRAKFGLPQ
jgi:hypothetical protein